MTDDHESRTLELIRHGAKPLVGSEPDYQSLLRSIGDAQVVLIGEASHGTHEFYRERARITRMLIEEKGFNAVAVEADWPDSYEVNRYVRGLSNAEDPAEALGGFQRFPTWMWRNTDVVDFIAWLRGYNQDRSLPDRVGFYGLDLYSLFTSIHVVIAYLEKMDPQAARQARQRYGCFDHFNQDLQNYGFMSSFGLGETCEEEVLNQLLDLQRHARDYASKDEEEFFNAEQNARLAKNAEDYYRAMFRGRVESWNLRDTHMFETLNALIEFLSRNRLTKVPAKVIVWAHNSHIGDARATEMGRHGELNIGQLVRTQFREQAFNIGFSTYTGTVSAASDWDANVERKVVRRGLPGSYELLFHETGIPNFMLIPREDEHLLEALDRPRLERAIGVIYAPKTERYSHYFEAHIASQFDTIIHFDETRAVEPLEITSHWHRGEEVPETFPSAL